VSTFGVLPSQEIKRLIENRVIIPGLGYTIPPGNIQPSSIDLQLGSTFRQVDGEFCPTQNTNMLSFVRNQTRPLEEMSTDGVVLHKNNTYLFQLMEMVDTLYSQYNLPIDRMDMYANPKSTTGRLGIATRLVASSNESGCNSFDYVKHGKALTSFYLFVRPMAFNVIVRPGDTLHQLRFFINDGKFNDYFPYRNNVASQDVDIDLEGIGNTDIVGYVAKRTRDAIDPREKGKYPREDFWMPIYRPESGTYLFSPNDFYIMASKTKVSIRNIECAELVPYDSMFGEFRIHHAGFFDPGFGYGKMGEVDGAHCVFEITPHIPVYLSHGQSVASLRKEPMWYSPQSAYGAEIGSSYQAQQLALAKQFI